MNNKKVFFFFITAITFFAHHSESRAEITGNKQRIEKREYGVRLGSTRIIYNEGQITSSFLVKNEKDYPLLIQTQVFDSDKKTRAPFIITPPIMKLDPGVRTRLKIIPQSNVINPKHESLYWVCVKGLPPNKESLSDEYQVANLNINVVTTSCIKLLTRPSSIKRNISDSVNELNFHNNTNGVVINNPTPFYMNISKITIGDKEINKKDSYIMPYNSVEIKHKGKKGDKLSVFILDDIGAEIKVDYII